MFDAIVGKEHPNFMSYETIRVDFQEAVCLITLNRPDRLNALTVEVAKDF